jgi:uncharacterized membrane protein
MVAGVLLAQQAAAFAPVSAFLPRTSVAHKAAVSNRSFLSMLQQQPDDDTKAATKSSPWGDLAKGVATAFAALAIMAGGAHDAEAARSGGRMGGRSFSSPAPSRSYSAPSRSYSAPSRSYNGGSYG